MFRDALEVRQKVLIEELRVNILPEFVLSRS